MPSLVSQVSRTPTTLDNNDKHSVDDDLTTGTLSDHSTAMSTAVSVAVSEEPRPELPVFYTESFRALLIDSLLLVQGIGRSTSIEASGGQRSNSRDEWKCVSGAEAPSQPAVVAGSDTPPYPSGFARPNRFETPQGSLNTILQTLERARQLIRAENASEKYIPGTPAATFEILDPTPILQSWRVRDRLKTAAVALILCLNVGVDPPDVIKPTPCARIECWIDPFSMSPQKALDSIGKALQLQYERWQPRARYRVLTDPIVDEVKKLCLGLRRTAKDERVLFHFNGHGVPKPTANGEIWVFNKNYTQYIPLSLYDLQSWLGAPAVYVFDCPAAGLAISAFLQFAEQREREEPFHQQQEQAHLTNSSNGGAAASAVNPSTTATGRSSRSRNAGDVGLTGDSTERAANVSNCTWSYRDSFLLGACQAHETLPTSPDMPADLFTSCLTTPIKVALRWHVARSVCRNITLEMIDRIPGRLNDRKTMLGELNWIFTAVTDTIAWNTFPRATFKRLYRQDLLVASLFRNFLLADRLMRQMNCTPVSYPPLPPTHQHPLWQAWDHAVEMCFARLPEYLRQSELDLMSNAVATASSPRGPCLALGSRAAGTTNMATTTATAAGATTAGVMSSLANLVQEPAALPAVGNHLMRPEPASNLQILHHLNGDEAPPGGTQERICRPPSPGPYPATEVRVKSKATSPRLGRSTEPTAAQSMPSAAGDQEVNPSASDSSCALLPSPFFENQMAAFEVWLDLPAHRRRPPEQLPIVLQVLLSQAHRLRALELLSRFLDTGPWAVDLALSVGIFPYVLRLLQSPAPELRAELVFIWAKILAVDQACTADLLKENGERYFLSYFASDDCPGVCAACAAFVLYMVLHTAADQFADANLLGIFLRRLEHPAEPVRRWTLLCLAAWLQAGHRMPSEGVVFTVLELLRTDSSPKVRAAAVQTLTVMMHLDCLTTEIAEAFQQSALNEVAAVVRKEIALVALPANAPARNVLANDPHPLVASLSRASWSSNEHCDTRALQTPAADELSQTTAVADIDLPTETMRTGSAPRTSHQHHDRSSAPGISTESLTAATAAAWEASVAAQTQTPALAQESTTFSSPSTILRRASTSLGNLLRHSWSHATMGLGFSPEHSMLQASSPNRPAGALEDADTGPQRDACFSASGLGRPQSHPNLFSMNSDDETGSSQVPVGGHLRPGECQSRDLFRYQKGEFSFSATRRRMHIRDYSYQEVLHSHTRQRWMGLEPSPPMLTPPGARLQGDSEETGRLKERWVTPLNGGDIWALSFHPSQALVLVGDAHGGITALDIMSGSVAWRFGLPRSTGGITALQVVNAHTTWPLLLVATGDGTIRVYESQIQLLAAFAAISRPTNRYAFGGSSIAGRGRDNVVSHSGLADEVASLVVEPSACQHPLAGESTEEPSLNCEAERTTTGPSHHHWAAPDAADGKQHDHRAGGGHDASSLPDRSDQVGGSHLCSERRSFVCDWSPWHGWLLSGGLEQGTIRLFDAEREMCIWSCIASSYRVTAVAHLGPELFMVGCADGAVYGYDARTGAAEVELLEHTSPVLAIQGRSTSTFPVVVSAAAAGDVRIWSEHSPQQTICVVAHRRDLTATAAHRYQPWVATGSASRSIKLFGEQGQLLQLIRHHDGPDAARIGPVSCLKFDETSRLLAAGDMDSVVTLYEDGS